jgi:hypothetical protein
MIAFAKFKPVLIYWATYAVAFFMCQFYGMNIDVLHLYFAQIYIVGLGASLLGVPWLIQGGSCGWGYCPMTPWGYAFSFLLISIVVFLFFKVICKVKALAKTRR